jgi:hypothetical protein
MFTTRHIQTSQFALNTGGSVITAFYLPQAARVTRYFAIPTLADQAAHSTIVVSATFVDEGTDGSGSTTLAVLTNDSDTADSTTEESGAWTRYDAKELNTEARPVSADATNVADEFAAGTVISCTLTGAGTTPTANNFIMGIEYRISD